MQSLESSSPGNNWGLMSFKQLPRTKAFVRVFVLLASILTVSSLPLFFNFGQGFGFELLTKVDFFLALLLLKQEGVQLKDWFKTRFALPKKKAAFVIGGAIAILPAIFAALSHRLLLGYYPQFKMIPFSGHVFGYFLVSTLQTSFEDISWRGIILPRALYLFPGVITLVVLGFFWGWWHIPFHLSIDYSYPEQIPRSLFYFVCVFIAFFTVFAHSEGSILPMLFTHGLYNTVITYTSYNIANIEGCSDLEVFSYFKLIYMVLISTLVFLSLSKEKKYNIS